MSASTASFESGMKNLSLKDDPQQQIASQGQWFQASDSDEDDQPLQLNNGANRPASVRMKRPVNFVKPPHPQFSGVAPADMRVIQSLFESYSQKVYIEGYAEKKSERWSRYYVELCGSALALWDAQFEGSNEQVVPEYIHITDLNADLLGKSAEPGKDNVLSLNSDGQIHLLLDFPNHQSLQQWVSAIHLSHFEYTKLQQIFTRHFLSRSTYADIQLKPADKIEGQIDVQLGNNKESQTVWAVVSDKVEEKKFFGKKSKPSKGHITLYESKKAKQPINTITNVVQAYIIYPKSAQQIDSVTSFKIEATGDHKEAIIKTTSAKELGQWIIGTFDAFKLYGRPDRLLDDSLNASSLNFGEPRSNGDISRLFLEVNEVSHIDMKSGNLTDIMTQLNSILSQKLQQQQHMVQQHLYARQSQQPMGLIHQIPSGVSMQNSQAPPQRASVYPNQALNMTNRPYGDLPQQQFGQPMHQLPQQMYLQQQQQPQQLRQQTSQQSTAKSHKVYASDDESEEDDNEENEDDEDDDDNSDIDDIASKAKKTAKGKSSSDNVIGGIEKKGQASKTSLATSQKSSTAVIPVTLSDEPLKQQSEEESDESSDEDDASKIQKANNKAPTRRSKPKVSRTQVSVSGSDDSDDDEEEAGYSGSDDDNIPIHQKQQQQRQQQQQQGQFLQEPFFEYDPSQQWDSASTYNASQNMMHPQYQGYYDENGYSMMGEDGPVIPQLGDRFATQNSLLDTYRAHHPSAHDQEDYARATGQPLIQVPNKPPAPRAGLVGMISQLEHEKKQEKTNKTRLAEMEKERILERERERYLMEQRQQMMQPMMNQGSTMNQNMMYPGMMPMMGNQMSMMNMMGQNMMYPGVMNMQNPSLMSMQNPGLMNMQNPGLMNMQNPSMMSMQMMPPVMDPRMSMMMMQQQYGQHPMWQQQQQMFNSHFNGSVQDDDEDDDVPLGAKEPSHTRK
ncbi:hypothetical protein EDC96DRAFT_523312 [Choanephora cucurbitarum]|nr:hypothetical protein EDC96DRAFT_523312 [Choanephora cucurbitarum]